MTLLSPRGISIVFLGCALWIWQSPRSIAARRTALAAAFCYLLASIYAVPYAIASALLTRHAAPFEGRDVSGHATAIVLLAAAGERVPGWSGAISVMSAAEASRVLEAARVFALVSPDWIISSGGADVPDDVPSGEVMRDALVQLGVPPARIALEVSSRTTHDEAVLVAPMLKRLGIQRTILVTSATHMPRSLGTFRAVGVDAIPAPALDPGARQSARRRWLPSARGLAYSALVLHECAGLVYYRARGWWTR